MSAMEGLKVLQQPYAESEPHLRSLCRSPEWGVGLENIDYRTGEEMAEPRSYVKAEDLTRGDRVRSAFGTLTSLNQRDRFMASIDKRRLRLSNNTRHLFDRDRGHSALHKTRPCLRISTFRNLQALVGMLDYQNYLYTTADELAANLEVHPKSVRRHLSRLQPMVKVYDMRHGLNKGVLRIAVSPAYGYRREPEEVNQERGAAIDAWYRVSPDLETLLPDPLPSADDDLPIF